MTDTELYEKAYNLGYKYESEYGACSQCVLATCFDIFDNWNEDVFRAGYGLSGGTALTSQGTCGALSGAIMAVSLIFGRTREQFDQGRKQRCYDLCKEVYDRFVDNYGSPLCRDVQEKLMGKWYCAWDLEDVEAYEKNEGHKKVCAGVVGNAAYWAAEVIQREMPASDIP